MRITRWSTLPLLCMAAMALAMVPKPVVASGPEQVKIAVDTSEAEAVLAILSKQSSNERVSDQDWSALCSTEPYKRLREREAAIHRPFTDQAFKEFVASPELTKQRESLEGTLASWRKADLQAAGRRVLAYLPGDAHIRAKVYIMIKPLKNSFVFELDTDPTIFLYLNPEVTSAEFENTVAHECHHVGFRSVSAELKWKSEELKPAQKSALEWMGAFGEGFAMLAAAGSPDVHPQATHKLKDRERWDRDMANFNRDLRSLETFFMDVISGKLKTEEEIDEKGFSFFGYQGPWYTVSYRMAVVIEKAEGRDVLIQCMLDPRQFIRHYNQDASALNEKADEKLALWSQDLLHALKETPKEK
jgi:hypothetical protein